MVWCLSKSTYMCQVKNLYIRQKGLSKSISMCIIKIYKYIEYIENINYTHYTSYANYTNYTHYTNSKLTKSTLYISNINVELIFGIIKTCYDWRL